MKTSEIGRDVSQLTFELCSSGVGLRCFKIRLAGTFFTTCLVLVGARGAAALEAAATLPLGADLREIGCFGIRTLVRGGDFLQKRTSGALGKKTKGEPSSSIGSGPSCCWKTDSDNIC